MELHLAAGFAPRNDSGKINYSPFAFECIFAMQ